MRRYSAFFLPLLLLGCLDPYDPKLPESATNVIVIDGFLNTRDATATVRILHTVSLQSKEHPPVVQGAEVTIQTSDGDETRLHEERPGTYVGSIIATTPGATYTLRVTTSDGRQYLSDDE